MRGICRLTTDRRRSAGRAALVAACATLPLSSCKIERLRSGDSAAAADTSSAVALDSGRTADRAAPRDPAVVPAAPAPMPIPPADPASRSDTTSAPAPDELAALRASLAIPVQGIRADQLRDTYSEARGERVHEALDIAAARHTPVLSAADGRLTKLHASVAGGLMIYAADPDDRFVLMYGHLERYADGMTEGMPLTKGQVIGYVGTSGNAPPDAPHLHFAIMRGKPSAAWWRGTPVNPYPLLAR